MINVDLCKKCVIENHSGSVWENRGKTKIACPVFRGFAWASGGWVQTITGKDNPPEGCPYELEHMMFDQRESCA